MKAKEWCPHIVWKKYIWIKGGVNDIEVKLEGWRHRPGTPVEVSMYDDEMFCSICGFHRPQ